MKTISLISAVLNSRDTIEDMLRSVEEQEYDYIEHVVIDGGSTDGTLDVLTRFRGRIAVLHSEPDDGIYDALNKGLRLCTGEVVGFLHADDMLANCSVIGAIARRFNEPDVQVVYGDLEYVSRDDVRRVVRRWRAGVYKSGCLARGWMPPHPTFYTRRENYIRFGSFDTRHRIAADYACMIRMLSGIQQPPVYIPEVLVRMRLGGVSNRSFRTLVRKSLEDFTIIRESGIGGLGTLLSKNFRKIPQFM